MNPSCFSFNSRTNCRFEIATPIERNKASSRGIPRIKSEGRLRLPLMVLHQHEAAEFRTEMAFNPDWQWSQHRPPVRRYPAFSLVTGRTYRNHQVLHQKGSVTLEPKSGSWMIASAARIGGISCDGNTGTGASRSPCG
jgi:hypothetical protein